MFQWEPIRWNGSQRLELLTKGCVVPFRQYRLGGVARGLGSTGQGFLEPQGFIKPRSASVCEGPGGGYRVPWLKPCGCVRAGLEIAPEIEQTHAGEGVLVQTNPSEGPLIRAATSADLATLYGLGVTCFPSDHWTEGGVAEELEREQGAFLVAELDGRLVGYLAASRVLDELEILQIATEPALRRQGIARCLLATVMEESRRGGCQVILLEVRDSNLAAREFYGRHGFRVFGRRRGYYAHPSEDAVLMMRHLEAPAGEPDAGE